MKTKSKLITFLLLSTGAALTTALINKYLKISATSRGLLKESQSCCYKWRLGNIHYTKTGSGKPLLLVHNLDYASSGYEWNQIVNRLKDNYTVYTIDLLGCGRSEKPDLTYTNYLYVQLLSDFIKSEIGHRTNVIATGESASLAVMACSNIPELFDQIMLVNPNSLLNCSQIPSKEAKLYKLIIELPIVGTLLYNIASSRKLIEESFEQDYFYNPYSVKPMYVDRYLEAAHLGGCPKAIFSSVKCNYIKCNLSNALKKIDNSIYIVGGREQPIIEDIIAEYKELNSAIEHSLIPKTKFLPQLESPAEFAAIVKMFFA